MTLGLFVFGMDTIAYDALTRRISWRHEQSERFMARAASQFAGPGEDSISISGRIVPEVTGSYGAITTLRDMADTGDNWALMDGTGRVLGWYRIDRMEETHADIMAGGLPRSKNFTLDLTRVK
ncbi:phage tail protein [Novosphingobium umbonatum]|uniref:Phage tail protein n=2 Tax=Novosphingobium umbonatum TaxID=1908524 RepID=A0A3S3TLT5_9SPHN|nr:phage tail protein [Novosphingobium umbonatum]